LARIVFVIQREELQTYRSVQPKILFPIEAAFAGALLIKSGHRIKCLDLNLLENGRSPESTLTETLEYFNPEIIISVPQVLTFLIKENYHDTVEIFKIAKAYNGHIKTIYCGSFATSYPKAAFSKTKADYLIRGEFDLTLLKLIDNISNGLPISGLDGVISSSNNSVGSGVSRTDNLDILPFPAYTEFNYKKYFRYPGRGNLRFPEYSRKYTHYQTSRGCSCQCSFCNVSFLRGGRKYRTRSLGLVLDDLEKLIKQYGIEEIHFLDENLTLDKERTVSLCQGIRERGLQFKWIASGGMNVYSLGREILELLWQAGCYRLNLAFESGSQEVLDNIIRKPVKVSRDIRILKLAKDIGFEIIGYFVIGLPGENRAQINQTLELARNPLFDYVTLAIATPLEGTDLKRICLEKGLLNKNTPLFEASRRATALYSTKEFFAFELEKIRWKDWDRINFSQAARKMKIAKMMGVNLKALERIRERTRQDFAKRWHKDFVGLGDRVGLAPLTRQDLKINTHWMKQPDLRRYLERPDENLTYKKQLEWFKKINQNHSKVVLKIMLLEHPDVYIGNVTAFAIERNKPEAELAIFIGEPEYRGKGYGTEAFSLFIKYLKQNINPEMVFRVKFLRENVAAYRLYKKLGFKKCQKDDFAFTCDDALDREYMVLLPNKK
jgi:radical SAM superfamily enzyme YgiQ (UPF0313 family)/GNAT superfamily N-acetyltransferase